MKKRFLTSILVPILLSVFSSVTSLPPLILICVPILLAQVVISTSLTEAIDGKASPRNPKVSIKNKSSSLVSFEVACLWKDNKASSCSIPIPLSVTQIPFKPPFTSSTLISLDLASIEFSTNSFNTEEQRSTTSPADILLARLSLMTWILLMASS